MPKKKVQKQKRLDIINNFEKLFSVKITKNDEEKNVEEKRIFIDKSYVFAVIPKKQWVADTIPKLFDVIDEKLENTANLKKTIESLFVPGKSVAEVYIASEYLKPIIEIVKQYDVVRIIAKRDTPFYIETDDFIAVIAGRVDEHWERFI